MGKYSDLIRESQDRINQQSARFAGIDAPDVAPDEMGRAMARADKNGLPPAVVAQNMADYDRQDQLDQISTAAESNPILAGWLGDPNQSALAKDDVGTLGGIGRFMRDGFLSAARVIPGAALPYNLLTEYGERENQKAADARGPTMQAVKPSWFSELAADFESAWSTGKQAQVLQFPDFASPRTRAVEQQVGQGLGYQGREDFAAAQTAQAIAQFGRESAAASKTTSETEAQQQAFADVAKTGDVGATVKAAFANPRALMSVVTQSLGATAPNLALSAALPASRLMQATTTGAGSGLTEYGFTVLDVMGEAGVDTADAGQVAAFLRNKPALEAARRKAAERGVAVAAFDALTAGFAGRLLANSRRGVVSPVLRTVGEGTIQAAGGAAGEASAQLASEGRIEDVGAVVLEAAAEVPTFIAEGRGQIAEARRNAQMNADRFDAQAEQKSITRLIQLASESKTRTRSARRFESLIQDMTSEGEDTVYLSADAARTLYQSEAEEGARGPLEGLVTASEFAEAAATGGELAIPLAKYVTFLSPEQHAKIADQVRMQPGTRHDVPAVTEEDITAAIRDGVAEAEGQEQRENGPAGQVFDEIYGQLLSKQGEKLARQNASIVQSVYRNLADRAGMDAWQLFQQFRINIPGARRDARGAPRGIDTDVDPLLDALREGKLPSDQDIFGEGLASALVRAGGLQADAGGELAAMEARQQRPGLISGAGMTLDDALVWAYQEGFISESPTQFRDEYSGDAPDIQTLLDLLGQDLSGNRVTRPTTFNAKRAAFRESAQGLQEELDQRGIDLASTSNQQVREALGLTEQTGATTAENDVREDEGLPRLYQSAVLEESEVDTLRRRVAELERELRTDNLTGLRNQRAFEEDEALGWSTVAAADMDGLKRLNDSIGHEAADQVLRALGAVMLAEEGDGARFYRRSGDEFAARFRDRAEADRVMADLQARLEEVAIDFDVAGDDGQIRPLTYDGIGISYGNGQNYAEADAGANRNKAERLAAGAREEARAHGEPRRLRPRRDSRWGEGRRADDQGPQGSAEVGEGSTLNQSPVDTEAFKAWSGGAPVYEGTELVTEYEGGPAVFELYHGTTADFDAFDRERANPESDMGAGFYFSNNPDDVAPNYAGTGPDLTNKIEREAERIANEEDLDSTDPEVVERARARFGTHEGATLKVYVRVQNPAIVGGDNETQLTYEENYNEELDEYEEPTGTLVDFVESLRNVADEYHDADVERTISDLLESGESEIPLSRVIGILKESEGLIYATDDEGNNVSNEIIRRALEDTGFDAIVDYTVDKKFGSQKKVGKAMEGLDADTVHVIAFEPTQIKSAIANRGTFDPSDPSILNQSERGSVTFRNTPEGRQFDINLLAGMDASTFVHELGHVYLELLTDLSQRDGAPQQIANDVATINEWLGREDTTTTTEQHEKFARGFEAYLREGKAPTSALRRVFAAFKVWMTAIYRNALALNVELTDDVRGVFDRIIASDAEIEEARAEQYQEALITDAVEVGMSPEDFAAYNAAVAAARADAEAVVAAELLRAMRIEQQAWYREERKKVQDEVTQDMRNQPVYRAQRLMRTGKLPDGSEAPDVLKVKFNKDDLLDRYGQSFLRNLRGMYSVEGGATSDEVAAVLGFRSGAELVNGLVNAPPINEAIKAETDSRMAERHPDPMVDGTLPDRAMVAAHRDRQADVMVREIRALEGRSGRPASTRGDVVKGIAKAIIDRKKLRQLQPATYRAAEAKAGKEAFEAARTGKWDEALAARRRQLLNFELFREAVRARNEALATSRRLAKFGETKTRQRLGKAGGEYLAQIDALLDRFDFKKISDKAADRRASLAAWIKLQSERGQELDLPDRIMDEAFRLPYRELSVEQLREVNDAVVAIDHLARLKGKLLLGKETRDAAQIDAEMAASVREATPERARTTGDRTNKDKIRTAFQQGRVLQATATDLARELDGFIAGGAVWRNTVGVITDAINNLVNPELRRAQTELAETYLKHYSKDEISHFGDLVPMPEVNGDLWSKRRLLALAMNWGNDGNREAILSQAQSRMTKGQVDALLGRLDARDWAFVQDVWQQIDSYWPAISEAQKRRTGLAPEKVVPTAFVVRTSDGKTMTIPGGYYPLSYEADSVRTMKDETEDYWNSMRAGRTAKAQTRDGHTIARVGSGGRTVKLDTGVIQSHLRDVIRNLYLGDAVNYVNDVLNGSGFKQAIDATGQQEYAKALEEWLKDVAAGEIGPRTWYENALRTARKNFTAAALVFKPASAALQITGVVQSSAVLGQNDTWQAVGQFLKTPKKMTAYVKESSQFMRSRMETHVEAIEDVMSAEAGKLRSGHAAMLRMGFWMMGRVQQQVDVATWLAGENQGMRLFDNDVAKARQYADDIVRRSQSSSDFADKSPIQRGNLGSARQSELVKGLTVLSSYLLAKGNAAYEITRKTNFKNPQQALRWAANMTLLFTIEGLIALWVRGKWPDDDDDDGISDEIAWAAGSETYNSLFGAIPGGSVMTSELRGYDSKGVVGAGWEAVYDLITQAQQGELDRGLVKTAVTLAGVTMGLPSAQINKTIDAVTASADGEDVSPLEYLTGPEKKK